MTSRLDPRTKLLLAVLYAAWIMTTRSLPWLLAELGLLWLGVFLFKEGRTYLKWLRVLMTMTIAWFLIAWWAFDLMAAVTASLRLLSLSSTFFLFFRTTSPYDLSNALVKSGLPYEVAFVFRTSLQFVPIISRKARNIFDAQRSRGIPLEPGWAALRHYPALTTPLLIQAFQLADELAEALEARGFSRPGRTFMRDYRLQAVDWAVLSGAVILLLAIILIP